MILTLKTQLKNNKLQLCLFVLGLGAFLLSASTTLAQSSLSLSVSPTIFDMTANPSQVWTSYVRVINPNPYEIKVFANVVNFAPDDKEVGQGRFVPVNEEETNGQTIAEWLDITNNQIVVPAEQTIEVPFKISVPADAPPGGHFAALLIGTKPPANDANTTVVETSQIVTTLVFLRVTGDINEAGDIRSFRTLKRLLEKPEVTFELRFENKGNVHLRPQGEIKILNMWGQERGAIPVNHGTLFGNVLPGSVRKFTFTWSGDWSLADMGRYTAVATLAYGENSKKFTDRETAFWVIPWKMFTVVLLVIFGFIWFFTWGIKLYIRKMLSLAGVAPRYGSQPLSTAKRNRRVSVVAPIEAGMLDLRGQWDETATWSERIETLTQFVTKYRLFFFGAVGVICFIGLIVWYIQTASVSERPYDVVIDGGEPKADVHISSEELKYQQLLEENKGLAEPEADADLPKLIIVNRSGMAGLAAELRVRLEAEGYEVLEIKNDFGAVDKNTVVVYAPEYADQAFTLSQQIYGALLSSFDGATDDEAPITIYVGQDMENAVQ